MNTPAITKKQIPTVLVVDDNANNLKVVALTLKELDYKIVIATNGRAAIDLVERTKPDLILLDVMMPEMDGFETCRIIKSKDENHNLPIIFLTAIGDKPKIVKGLELGGVDYITKPFNKEELISRIKTHLELKLIRDELQKTTDHLKELNELKDKLFSVIGHDLRSPLGSIKMTLDLLLKGVFECNSAEYKETLQTLLQSSNEVFDLLENLLGWAKAQSGILNYRPEQILLNNVLESTYFMFKSNLNLKKIDCTIELDEHTELYSDVYLLKIVLGNIVSNAIKFTPNGGKICISAKQLNDKIILSVTDTGVGIPEEHLSKLLDEKQHYTSYGTNGESGSGLGLKVTKEFVEKLNGKMRIESTPGKGSTVSLELPVHKN